MNNSPLNKAVVDSKIKQLRIPDVGKASIREIVALVNLVEEETNVKIIRSQYLFVVENRFLWNGKPFHGVEHYLEVEIDRFDVESRESHLSQHWLPLDTLAEQDLRPHVVRDAIASGDYRNIRNLVVPFEE